jgi:transitional endoplasmic reticulum ATPase
MPLTKDVYLEALAKETEGFTGADIEAVCRESGMDALRLQKYGKKDKIEVTPSEFKKVIAELKRSKGLIPLEKDDASEKDEPKLNYVK